MTATPKLVLTGPSDFLAAVPYLIGFHPADSIVVAGLSGPALRLCARWDLPSGPGDLDRMLPLLRRERVTAAVVAGYGPGLLVAAAMDEATDLLRGAGIGMVAALRAEDGRYWCSSCLGSRPGATCCPPEGTPYDPKFSPVAAEAVALGWVALPGRHSLRASVQPCGGVAMRRATRRVAAELRARLAGPDGWGDRFAAAFVAEALGRVRGAMERYEAGGRLEDHEVARLGFDLAVIRVRDEAWALLDGRQAHVTLWRDVTRRLEPRYVPPAASLLAAAAWRAGECTLAGMALDRALAADPGYSMAILLRQALAHLLPPAALAERMPSPRQLDAEMGPPRVSWLAPLRALLERNPPG